MGTKDKQEHQPEPWTQDGRYILDASGWTLASARFPGDARRIIARRQLRPGIPTDALESWVVNVIGEPLGRADVDRRRAVVARPSRCRTSAACRRAAARRPALLAPGAACHSAPPRSIRRTTGTASRELKIAD